MIPDVKLRVWWNSIAQDSRFEHIRMYVRASYIDGEPPPNPDQIKGAKLFEALLLTIAAGEESSREIPGPGLTHDLDNPQPTLPEAPKNEPPAQTKKVRKRS